MRLLFRTVIAFLILLLFILPASCSDTETTASEKISNLLLTQVNLKKEQIDDPTTERLEMMRNMGMVVDNLESQRLFIHLERELDDAQAKELQDMGLTLYPESWLPPVGAHPTGFILADMPLEVLGELADKEYIVNLDTAEVEFQPQTGSQPQGE